MKDELFLLSVEEYEKYKGVIPVANLWWWLRSPGNCSNRAALVTNDGSVYTYGNYVDFTDGIRPALKVSKSEIENLKIGDRKIYYDFPFIKIDEDLLIAEVPIAFDKFDYESNDYEKSYVKRFLEEWKRSRERLTKKQLSGLKHFRTILFLSSIWMTKDFLMLFLSSKLTRIYLSQKFQLHLTSLMTSQMTMKNLM